MDWGVSLSRAGEKLLTIIRMIGYNTAGHHHNKAADMSKATATWKAQQLTQHQQEKQMLPSFFLLVFFLFGSFFGWCAWHDYRVVLCSANPKVMTRRDVRAPLGTIRAWQPSGMTSLSVMLPLMATNIADRVLNQQLSDVSCIPCTVKQQCYTTMQTCLLTSVSVTQQ